MISEKGKKNGMITWKKTNQKKKAKKKSKKFKNLNVGMGNFVQNTAPGFLSNFLLNLGREHFGGPKEKTPNPTNFPSSILSNQIPTKITLHFPLKSPQPNGP